MTGQILYAFSKEKRSSVHLIPTIHTTIVGLVSTGGKDMHYLMFLFHVFFVAPFYESKPNIYEDFPCEEATSIASL